jgi:transposase
MSGRAYCLCRHLENILSYLTHRITNAATEGLNARTQWIKYSSRGFRDRERFKLASISSAMDWTPPPI